jgi:hypothetical protein
MKELLQRRSRRPGARPGHAGAQAGQILRDRGRGQLDHPALGMDHLLEPRLERPQIDPVRRRLDLGEREPVRPPPEAVAVRPDAQQHVHEPLRPDRAVELGRHLVDREPLPRAALVDCVLGEAAKDEVVDGAGGRVAEPHQPRPEPREGASAILAQTAAVEKGHFASTERGHFDPAPRAERGGAGAPLHSRS